MCLLVLIAWLVPIAWPGSAGSAASTPRDTPPARPASLARAAPPQRPVPQRIVSLNLCADQLVIQLVDRPRIAAVTWLALDRRGSAVADEAAGLTTTYGTAEEVVRLRPDLVIAGRYTTRTTVALLRRFGYHVMEIDTPVSFEQVEAQVREVADAVGASARGARLVDDMRARLARVRASLPDAPRPVAAVFGTSGLTQGSGTLMDAILRASGLRNMAAEIGLRGFSRITLEQLVLSRPDVILLPGLVDEPPATAASVSISAGGSAEPTSVDRVNRPGAPAPDPDRRLALDRPLSLDQQLLVHPALMRGGTARPPITLPSKWIACGGPATVTAVEYLHRATR